MDTEEPIIKLEVTPEQAEFLESKTVVEVMPVKEIKRQLHQHGIEIERIRNGLFWRTVAAVFCLAILVLLQNLRTKDRITAQEVGRMMADHKLRLHEGAAKESDLRNLKEQLVELKTLFKYEISAKKIDRTR